MPPLPTCQTDSRKAAGLTVGLLAGCFAAAAAVSVARTADEAAIRAASKAYVAALDAGDKAHSPNSGRPTATSSMPEGTC